MSIKLNDLKWYASSVTPDDDSVLGVGGAIDLTKRFQFQDVNGTLQAVSSNAGDTTQTVTISVRDNAGVIVSFGIALNGTTVVTNAQNAERLLKAVKSATCAGDVAVEAQTAERANTAQAFDTADTIKLDSGASGTDNFYTGMIIRLTGGTGSGQIREIIYYDGTSKIATVSKTWGTNPDATSTFRIAKGFFFEKSPTECLEVRRPFYNAAANSPGGGAKKYYDKGFAMNRHGTLTLTTAVIVEDSDPTARIAFALATAINDTGDNGGSNNRLVAPAGLTFNSSDKAVPGNQLAAADKIGVWFEYSLADGDVAVKTTYTPKLTGNTT